MHYRPLLNRIFYCLLLIGLQITAIGQVVEKTPEEKEKPNQLDILKVNLTQIAVNEVRFLYEMELRPASSLEFGTGFIYPNQFWFTQGGTMTLATGAGAYIGYRKYRTAKRYFTTPFMRSYVSPMAFYRYSTYDDEWLLFQGPSPELSECALVSENIHQLGTALRFGGQTTQGTFVMDLYAGIGLKYQFGSITQSGLNAMTDVCEVTPDTDHTVTTSSTGELQVIIQAGLKIGLRRENRERNYEEKGIKSPEEVEGDNPPIFQP